VLSVFGSFVLRRKRGVGKVGGQKGVKELLPPPPPRRNGL